MADLMNDLARFAILFRLACRRLLLCQVREDAPGQLRPEPQTLKSSNETVATEWRIEPRHTRIRIRTGWESSCHHMQVRERPIHPGIELPVRSSDRACVRF